MRDRRGARQRLAALALSSSFSSGSVMAIDLAPLWDFAQPALSEQRLRAALQGASGDDALILQTQIARSFGLRKDFERARELLRGIEPQIAEAGPEAQVRFWLELGRSHASATHPPDQQTAENQALARAAYQRALDSARAARLDGLAVDAIHMLAFVDRAPADQLRWAQAALAVVETSDQPAARRWEASVRNNVGYALHLIGRYSEALDQFEQALRLRERGNEAGVVNAEAVRSARWMVAWTLRALQRADEALALQLRLEAEADAAGAPDRHVFDELEILYSQRGDAARAAVYAARRNALVR